MVDGCGGIGPASAEGEVTWTSGGRLMVGAPGAQPRCLLAVPPSSDPVRWGPGGDRVLAGAGGARVGDTTRALPVGSGSATWSYPTGTSVLGTSDGRLRKIKVADAAEQDVSFLARHDETVYHPRGRYLFSAGRGEDGTEGIFMATNAGENPRPVAVERTASRLYSLAFNQGTLVFVAEHPENPPGDRYHIHYRPDDPSPLLFQVTVPGGPVARMVSSGFGAGDFHVAVAQGSCAGGRTVAVSDIGAAETDISEKAAESALPLMAASFQPIDVGAADTEPVGWLPGGRIVVLARKACGEPGTLWVVPPAAGGKAEPIADGVESAAIRIIERVDGISERPTEATGDGPPPVA